MEGIALQAECQISHTLLHLCVIEGSSAHQAVMVQVAPTSHVPL